MISGVPLNGAPQMMAETVIADAAAEGGIATTSLADKARVLTAGGEIGMMDGAANLAVDAKTGFFNIKVSSGSEIGIVKGEININNNQIGFNNIEITNANGGLGSIDQQNSIGLTVLTKAGGYNKATVEFSRLRPPGSKLP